MVQKTRLENGIRVLSQHCPNTHVVSVGIWIDSGSRDELPSMEGITHFLEHMFFKGTERRTTRDIAVELDILGGMSNAFTTKENLCFYGKVLDKNLPRLMDIFCDILLHARMDERELEKERFVILQEISMVEDTPEDYVHTVACEKFWKGHPLGHPICGYRETVQRFRREDILKFKDQIIHPEQVVVSAAGSVRHDELVEMVNDGLGRLRANGRGRPPRTSPEPVVFRDYIRKDLEQTHICLLMPGVSLHDEERFAVYILNIVLGNSMSSRLFQEVREKRGLAYNIYSFLHCCEDTGVFGVYAAVAPEKLAECFKVIWNEMEELIAGGVSETEISGAKDCAVGGMYLNLDSTDALMNRIARNEFLYGHEVAPDEIEKKIYGVSSENLGKWFARVFPDRVSILVVGPSDKQQVDLVMKV
ncbi:M16 family metallopeptidase [Thermodesulforhabdus norvegica]|uniref:Predicted Zn-dependent peptidase n=1 Tax=Thermodesulforhabdus norvegica TaxID=39841 RepID=A0A1I4VLE8_9BACT|nr:pitrilysin family protein [Thermodesulforhabdus norvegica]SFN01980.1 Predicted Zn-dependent peptidase [Thermodesulforhabdus norvegica]